jgi:hypothetical protein
LGISLEDSQKTFVFKLNEKSAEGKKKGVSGVKHPFCTPCSISHALRHFVDLRGAVTKKTLKSLIDYC